MVLNPIGSAVNGLATDPLADGSKHAQNTALAQSQGVQTTLSSDKASVSVLAAKAMESSKTSQHRVEALRAAVDSGSYSLDPAEIASALANHYSA